MLSRVLVGAACAASLDHSTAWVISGTPGVTRAGGSGNVWPGEVVEDDHREHRRDEPELDQPWEAATITKLMPGCATSAWSNPR